MMLFLVPGAAFAASDLDFYERLLVRGIAHFADGNYAAAGNELRIAAFGLADVIDEYERAHVYLTVAASRLHNDTDARASLMRIIAAQRVQSRYAAIALPAPLRQEFEKIASAMLTTDQRNELHRAAVALPAAGTSGEASPVATAPQPRAQPIPAPAPASSPAPAPAPMTTGEPRVDFPTPQKQPVPSPVTILPKASPAPQPKPLKLPMPQPMPVPVAPKPQTAPSSSTPKISPRDASAAVAAQQPAPATKPAPSPARPAPSPARTPATNLPPAAVPPAIVALPGVRTTAPAQPSPPPAQPVPSPAPRSSTRLPVDLNRALTEGQRSLEFGDLATARQSFRSCLDSPSLTHEEALKVGEGLYRTHDFDGAVRAFQRSGTFSHAEAQWQYDFAVSLFETGHYREAREALAAALPFIEVTPEVAHYRTKIEGFAH